MGKKTKVSIGDKYNRWTIIGDPYYKDYENSFRARYVNCVCVCGTEKHVKLAALTSPTNPSISCGCLQKEVTTSKTQKLDVGTVFGRLTVLESLGVIGKRNIVLVSCECGSVPFKTRLDTLKNGRVKSCSCLQKEIVSEISTVHGMSGTSAYSSWQSMKERCRNTKSVSFYNYGERGINFPDRWINFSGFWEEMSEGWFQGADIDRIDYNLGYSKENCRWVDRDVGNHNKSKPNNCTSVYKGVYYDKERDKWAARLNRNGIIYLQKRFDYEMEAAIAYDNASEEIYGDRPNKTIMESPHEFEEYINGI